MKIKYKYFIFFFLYSFLFYGQDLPPIVKFKSNVYGAGNQNWMVSEDENQFIYFANNEGLLEYNGSNWTLYPSPNETIIRSVKVIGNRVYTGCYMEFGYWERMPDGILKYFSLSNKIKNKLIEDEHFWNILNIDNWVLFQSFNRIYVYDLKKKSFQFIDNFANIFRIYKVDNSIYFQAVGDGLFEVVNGKSVLICSDERIKNNRIVEIFDSQDGLLLQTERAGVFQLKGSNIQPFHFVSETELIPNSIFCAKKLANGGFALGTISNGIYILDASGGVNYHLTQNSGLSNNTILSLNEDSDNNLWLGLDNGIDCINLQSPVKSFG